MKNTLIAALIAFAIGVCAGYYTKAKFYQAAEVKQVVKAQEKTAANIIQAHQDSVRVEGKVEQVVASIDATRQTVQRHIEAKIQEAKQSEKTHEAIGACDEFYLDADTVRMLNGARKAATLGASGSSDAAGQAPAATPVSGNGAAAN